VSCTQTKCTRRRYSRRFGFPSRRHTDHDVRSLIPRQWQIGHTRRPHSIRVYVSLGTFFVQYDVYIASFSHRSTRKRTIFCHSCFSPLKVTRIFSKWTVENLLNKKFRPMYPLYTTLFKHHEPPPLDRIPCICTMQTGTTGRRDFAGFRLRLYNSTYPAHVDSSGEHISPGFAERNPPATSTFSTGNNARVPVKTCTFGYEIRTFVGRKSRCDVE